jgi:hypothetical protein
VQHQSEQSPCSSNQLNSDFCTNPLGLPDNWHSDYLHLQHSFPPDLQPNNWDGLATYTSPPTVPYFDPPPAFDLDYALFADMPASQLAVWPTPNDAINWDSWNSCDLTPGNTSSSQFLPPEPLPSNPSTNITSLGRLTQIHSEPIPSSTTVSPLLMHGSLLSGLKACDHLANDSIDNTPSSELLSQTDHSTRHSISGSNSNSPNSTKSLPLSTDPPSNPEPRDSFHRVKKRTLNTLAARRYRQKRVDQMSSLESTLKQTETERDELRLRVARLEAEVEVLRGLVGPRS